MHSTGYTLRFIVILTSVVALLLTGLREVTKTQAELNETIFNKKEILKAIATELGENVEVKSMGDPEVEANFSKIEQLAVNINGDLVDEAGIKASGYKGGKAIDIDMAKEKKKPESERIFPLFVYSKGGEKIYILNVRGNGLWDEIWGNIAVKSDFSTIVGVSFDHKGETPGLGAEIKDNPAFPNQFRGKKLRSQDNDYVSVLVKKGGADKGNVHEVDGISGATVTADGVSEMLDRCIKYYEKYYEKNIRS